MAESGASDAPVRVNDLQGSSYWMPLYGRADALDPMTVSCWHNLSNPYVQHQDKESDSAAKTPPSTMPGVQVELNGKLL